MAFVPRLDFHQLELEARRRWLRPAEISEILRNYHKFQISSEPPNKPPSGSLFLFDRKVLRYFRKDGHNWRKKNDGKTIKEAHEKLKVGSVDVLHCYYAHGEENENFQRRCYWLLQQDMMHIVFVHYLEVKGNKMNVGGIREGNEVISNIGKSSPLSSPLSYSSLANHTKASSGITDLTSPTSTLSSSCENADSGHDGVDSHQVTSRSYSLLESLKMQNVPTMENIYSGLSNSTFLPPNSENDEGQSSISGDYASHNRGDRPRDDDECISIIDSQRTHSLGSWEEILKYCTRGNDNVPSHVSMGVTIEGENTIHSELLAGETAVEENYGSALPVQSNFQIPFADNSLHLSKWTMDQTSNLELEYELGDELFEQRTYDASLQSASETFYNHLAQQNELPIQNNLQQLRDAESQRLTKSDSESEMHRECNINYSLPVKQKLLDREGGLEKADSFSRWVTKELEDVDDLHLQSYSGLSWNTAECGHVVEDSSVSPFLSQDQLFSIIDFSPKWAYRDSNVEVVVIGKFLESQLDVAKYNWSCMFGEEEVPADILADGALCCHAPPHTVGRVPFYITCSNRLACSEVREFEYVVGSIKDVDIFDIYGGATNEINLHLRLEKLLAMRSLSSPNHLSKVVSEKQRLISNIISLKEEEERYQMGESTVEKNISQLMVKEQLLDKLMKEKLFSWLLHKVIEDGKGPNILDDEGQGVLHLAAALGYDWAIKPTVTAGVSINFRDVNGWTALHWAAFYGREQSVAVLISLGAAPGALTDPSPEFPLGRSPADLASSNGHKGISGFLAESSLTSHLSSLTMNDSTDSTIENTRARAVLTVSDRTPTPLNDVDVSDELSLKDSLTAICNATQAADRIHQVFRMQSFQQKQLAELGANDFGMLDEQALSLFTAKAHRAVQGKGLVHTAALQIQKNFRGWKKRKEFLLIRQRIVKIQAHVRGHQVRKQYRPIIWSVGILEKVILRWRRKGSGLRGFRRDTVDKHPDPTCVPLKEDDYDFLKEGKKQTEERLQKALDRVKSMVQYPEARAQYRRLLTVVEGFRETKACDMEINSSEELGDGDQDLTGIDSLLNDDTFMSIGFD